MIFLAGLFLLSSWGFAIAWMRACERAYNAEWSLDLSRERVAELERCLALRRESE